MYDRTLNSFQFYDNSFTNDHKNDVGIAEHTAHNTQRCTQAMQGCNNMLRASKHARTHSRTPAVVQV